MNEIYIQAASSITRQKTFGRSGFSRGLIDNDINTISGLHEPEYKNYIPPASLRRTPKINRMALACTAQCLEQFSSDSFDAIIVGTGLGCLTDTEKFLKSSIMASKGSMIPPTAFIQSGHNAISGQIALSHKNHGYNMTHVHQGLSFEHALLDAMLYLQENHENVLLGAVEEKIDQLETLANQFSISKDLVDQISEGSSFFILNTEALDSSIRVMDVRISSSNWETELEAILMKFDLNPDAIDMAFIGENLSEITSYNLPFSSFEYTKICGRYFSSSAFGFHLAADYLQNTQDVKHAIIINFASQNQIGLTLLSCD